MRTISTNFLNLKFENLCKNESFSKTIFACLTGAQGGSIHEKNYKKILWNYHFEYINQNALLFEKSFLPNGNVKKFCYLSLTCLW